MCVQPFTQMDPTSEACGRMSTYCGVVLPPFLTPKEPSCTCADREVFLDFRSSHFISLFYQHSAFAISFVLECLGETKALILLHFTNPS